MAYSKAPSRSERVVLERLADAGFTDVTVGRLRRWYRNGLPRVSDLVVEFACLLDALGPRHTDQALLILAGAHPDAFDAVRVSVILDRWFDRHYGALPHDLTRGIKCVYSRLSQAGAARRRASGLTLAEELERDLRAADYDTSDPDYWTVSPIGERTFNVRAYARRWISQIPATERVIGRTDAATKLRALQEGHRRATLAGYPHAAPHAALDFLSEQTAQRPMAPEERTGLLATLAVGG